MLSARDLRRAAAIMVAACLRNGLMPSARERRFFARAEEKNALCALGVKGLRVARGGPGRLTRDPDH